MYFSGRDDGAGWGYPYRQPHPADCGFPRHRHRVTRVDMSSARRASFFDGQHGDVDVTFIPSGNSASPNTPPATPIPRAQSAAETCSHLYRSHDGDTLTHAGH